MVNEIITQEEISNKNTFLLDKYLSKEFKSIEAEKENMHKTLIEYSKEEDAEKKGINQFCKNVANFEEYQYLQNAKEKRKNQAQKNQKYILELRKKYNNQKLNFRVITALVKGHKIKRKILSTPYSKQKEIITNNGEENIQLIRMQISSKANILYNHFAKEGITAKIQYRTASTELIKRLERIENLKNKIIQLSTERGATKQKAKTDKIKKENKPKAKRLVSKLQKLTNEPIQKSSSLVQKLKFKSKKYEIENNKLIALNQYKVIEAKPSIENKLI